MLFTHVYIFPCFGDKELSGYLFKCLLVEPGLRLISVCRLKAFACSCRQELLPDRFYLPFSFRALFKFCDLTSFKCVAPLFVLVYRKSEPFITIIIIWRSDGVYA